MHALLGRKRARSRSQLEINLKDIELGYASSWSHAAPSPTVTHVSNGIMDNSQPTSPVNGPQVQSAHCKPKAGDIGEGTASPATSTSAPTPAEKATRSVPTVDFDMDVPKGVNDRGEDAKVWRYYVDFAASYDSSMIEAWNEAIDVFLIFAALFSGVLTAFLIAAYPSLQPDTGQATVDALTFLSQQVAAGLSGAESPAVPFAAGPSTPPTWAIWANCLWFTSLVISLLTAVMAMLVKEWLRAYARDLPSAPLERARRRQFRYQGIISWGVPEIVSSLPLCIHLAVFIFLAGLVAFVYDINPLLSALLSILLGASVLLYAGFTILPVLFPDCPYKSQLSVVLCLAAEAFVRRVSADSITQKHGETWFSPSFGIVENLQRQQRRAATAARDAIDAQALQWLCSTCADRNIRETALLALVGWNPPTGTWRALRSGLEASANAAIAMNLASNDKPGRTEPSSGMISRLAAFASLLVPGNGKQDRWRAIDIQSYEFMRPFSNERTGATSSAWLMRGIYFLYYSQYMLKRGTVISDPSGLLIPVLMEELEKRHPNTTDAGVRRVSLFGWCMLLGYIRQRQLPLDSLSWVMKPLKILCASASSMPPEFLSSVFSILDMVTDPATEFNTEIVGRRFSCYEEVWPLILKALIRLLELEGSLEPWLSQWSGRRPPISTSAILEDIAGVIEITCENTKRKSPELSHDVIIDIHEIVMSCLAKDPTSTGIIRTEVISALDYLLPPESEVKEPGPPSLRRLTVTKTVMALCSVMDEELNISTVMKFLLMADASDDDFLGVWSQLEYWLMNHTSNAEEFAYGSILTGLIKRIRHLEDGPLSLPAIAIAEHMLAAQKFADLQNYMHAGDNPVKDAGKDVVESGWLEMMESAGLDYLVEQDNADYFQRAVSTIEELARVRGADVLSSGLIQKLRDLHDAERLSVKMRNFLVLHLAGPDTVIGFAKTFVPVCPPPWPVVTGYRLVETSS